MAICYKKLWKMLIDKDMMKKDLRAMTGVSTKTMRPSISSRFQLLLQILVSAIRN